jgi:release factor glutamine methyltransferase
MIHQSNFHSIPKQAKRLDERHSGEPFTVELQGMNIVVEPGVYQTSGDSELMAESVKITNEQNFLEVGCGTGIVSIAVAKRARHGTGIDINEKAVANSKHNAEAQNIGNVDFFVSDVFENVSDTFDIIICNPPYTKHEVRDAVDRMFWDPEDEMKKNFFKEVGNYLKPDGRIYFGWADFADIEVNLPFALAEENGYKLTNTFIKPHKKDFNFYVFEFVRKN